MSSRSQKARASRWAVYRAHTRNWLVIVSAGVIGWQEAYGTTQRVKVREIVEQRIDKSEL